MTRLEQERRAHPRVQAPDLPLKLVGANDAFRVRDISQSGVAFYADSPVPLMTRVQFEIQLPSTEDAELSVKGEGAVVRCERISPALGHYEVAVFFQHLEGKCLDHLKKFLRDTMA